MGVIAIIAALLIEQWRPLGDRKSVNEALGAWAGWLEQSFNGGERRHGIVAWLVAVIPAAAGGAVLHASFYALHPLLALAFNIAALYVTLGFRHVSHHFTALQLAIKSGAIERPRLPLRWSAISRTRSTAGAPRRRAGPSRTPASCSPPAPARWVYASACRRRKSTACTRVRSSDSASPPTPRFWTAPWAWSGARWCAGWRG